jgi:TonB family protein
VILGSVTSPTDSGDTLSYPIFHDRPKAAHKVVTLLRVSAVALIFIFLLFVSIASAQKAGKRDRAVIARVQPAYPAIMKEAHIGGIVRLNATVLANGTVTKVVILGGNPALADGAVQAVRQWKFAAGPSRTEEEVILRFDPY